MAKRAEQTGPVRRRVPLDEGGLPTFAKDVHDNVDDDPDPLSGESDCECPRLDPSDWDEVESDWSDITFLRAHTNAVLGVPVGYDGTRKELRARAAGLGLEVPADAMLLVGSGRFRRPVMLEVEGSASGNVDGKGKVEAKAAKGIEQPGGIAFSRLISAPWGQMQGLVDETRDMARARYGKAPDGVWVWYITCRECSAARNFETLILAHYAKAPAPAMPGQDTTD